MMSKLAALALLGAGLIAGAAKALPTAATQPSPVVKHAEELEWIERDTGVRVALLYGDPSENGTFVLRLRYPPGYEKAPHYHAGDAFVTVLSGSYYRGYGPRVVRREAHRLRAGTFSVNPQGVSHYEWTTEPAELQVVATGPWVSVYVDETGKPLGREESGMPR